jgi:hypothetical protein
MNLGKYIFGIREEYILRLEQEKREEQFLSYNILAAMFFVLVALAFISGFCFGLILFQSWIVSFILGIGFAAISFILLLLVLFLNMNTSDSELQGKMNDFEAYYQSIKEKRFETVTDEEALAIILEHEQLLRISNAEPQKPEFHLSQFFIATTKIVLVLVISFIVANGIEMLMFHGKLNDAVLLIKNSKEIKSVPMFIDELDGTLCSVYKNVHALLAQLFPSRTKTHLLVFVKLALEIFVQTPLLPVPTVAT